MRNPEGKIIRHLEESLTSALSSMTGRDFTVAADGRSEAAIEDPIVWRQAFALPDDPCIWLVAGKGLWTTVGQLTLEAAGLDSVTEDDCRSTWREILGQTVGGLATAFTADLQTEINAARGEEQAAEPPETPWIVFSVRLDENNVWPVRAAWSRELVLLYDPPGQLETASAPRESAVSKTFDLLLDVALPVSVSFGKTALQIREVLKLNTGSIVELNRFVAEPVDVIVNDCVIARGEVVVVDGNYGVRITHLASREDRLRSGMTEHVNRAGAGR